MRCSRCGTENTERVQLTHEGREIYYLCRLSLRRFGFPGVLFKCGSCKSGCPGRVDSVMLLSKINESP